MNQAFEDDMYWEGKRVEIEQGKKKKKKTIKASKKLSEIVYEGKNIPTGYNLDGERF